MFHAVRHIVCGGLRKPLHLFEGSGTRGEIYLLGLALFLFLDLIVSILCQKKAETKRKNERECNKKYA